MEVRFSENGFPAQSHIPEMRFSGVIVFEIAKNELHSWSLGL
jgi:hypothetical protein